LLVPVPVLDRPRRARRSVGSDRLLALLVLATALEQLDRAHTGVVDARLDVVGLALGLVAATGADQPGLARQMLAHEAVLDLVPALLGAVLIDRIVGDLRVGADRAVPIAARGGARVAGEGVAIFLFGFRALL